MTEDLESMLIRHEGMKLRVYLDPKGHATIGCGRNLDSLGISEQEALTLLRNDIFRIRAELLGNYPWFSKLDSQRQDAILDMYFNLGGHGFSQFIVLKDALASQNWNRASSAMLQSLWAGQVGKRAVELAGMIRAGVEGS